MNELTAQVRRYALEQIFHRRGPNPWRPDSTTGITRSSGNVVSEHPYNDVGGFGSAEELVGGNTYESRSDKDQNIRSSFDCSTSSDSEGAVPVLYLD